MGTNVAPHNPTGRFSDRVENYIRYRPGYPAGVVELLAREIGLMPAWVIADIGSGTGISSELFLKNGNSVVGVEPNGEMRLAAERLLAGYPSFRSVDGRAEATTLRAGSVELVVAMQAFHWFDVGPTRTEFARILKPGSHVVFVWNTRKTDGSPFLAAYEQMLRTFGTDYQQVRHDRAGETAVASFFAASTYRRAVLPNQQLFNFEGLSGRLLSSSYAPAPGHPGHAPMMAQLRRIFDLHQADGTVSFEYDTEVYWA